MAEREGSEKSACGVRRDAGAGPEPPSSLLPLLLVPELPLSSENHCDTMLVRGRDDFGIADGAPGMHDGADPGFGRLVHAVAEGEEGVRAEHRAPGLVAYGPRLVHGEKRGVDA